MILYMYADIYTGKTNGLCASECDGNAAADIFTIIFYFNRPTRDYFEYAIIRFFFSIIIIYTCPMSCRVKSRKLRIHTIIYCLLYVHAQYYKGNCVYGLLRRYMGCIPRLAV